MLINIQPNGFNAKANLRIYINEKIGKLSRFYSEIIAGKVTLTLINSDTKENKLCEIRLVIPGNVLLARSYCRTFEEAALNAVEILKGQIIKKKTKIIGTRNDIVPQKL